MDGHFIVVPDMDDLPITEVSARAFTIPTDEPESDGTLQWDSTTLVVVTVEAGGETGLGWTYGHAAAAQVIETDLAKAVMGLPAMDVAMAWAAMTTALRNSGRPGLGSMAIAAVDIALWDLKGQAALGSAGAAAGALSRQHPGVWKRRFHLLLRRAPAQPDERLGR